MGSGVFVEGIDVAVGNSVAFTPQAVSASPADVRPATLRKSLRVSLLRFIFYSLVSVIQVLTRYLAE
jgi:hypothetical protein